MSQRGTDERPDGGGPAVASDARPRLPGEVQPPWARRLERPPGERLAVPESPPPLDRPRMARALAFGLAADAALGVAWLVLGGALGLEWGLAVLALAGGWLVGTAIAAGAWGGDPHVDTHAPRLLAVGLALAAWLGGQVAVYFWTRVTLPESTLSLGQRIAATPFTDYFGGIVGPLEVLEVVLVAGAAYVASR